MEEERQVTGAGAILPKRFYQSASVVESDGAFALSLDGKLAKTRLRAPLAAQVRSLADAIADEWSAQGAEINFAAMPMTRYQMTVIDRADLDAPAWRGVVLSFLKTDLLCYRASSPADLARRQAVEWDPLLAWAASEGVALKSAPGAAFIEQPRHALDAGEALLARASDASLLAIKEAAEIAGSAVIAFALWRGAFEAEPLFDASRVDETYQAETWGSDSEAETRARRLKRDFLAAARYLSLIAAAG
ncbi:MAG: ATP12 family protein [Parvularculaceae bacterium]|nr:ATP12 family protein [Parvularculaceae bacterium]